MSGQAATWAERERRDRVERVAKAAHALVESITSLQYYSSGKWTATGTDETLARLSLAIDAWRQGTTEEQRTA